VVSGQWSQIDTFDLDPPLAYPGGAHLVVESPDFATDAKAAGLTEDEVRRIISSRGPAFRTSCSWWSARATRSTSPQAERNQLRKEHAGLADDYRKGIRRHVRSR
jgi:hypothetical protein